VVPEVDQALRLRAQRAGGQETGAPVLDHGGIERRLADLVLEEHAPVGRQRGVDLARAVQVAIEGAAEVLLAGEVAAVADPHRQRLAAELAPDLDALEIVLDRLRARGSVGVREAAELVAVSLALLVAEGVGVHGVEGQAGGGRGAAQLAPIAALVPGDVQRDGGRGARQLLDHAAVLQFVEHMPRLARAGKAREACAAGAHAPARDRHAEGRGPLAHLFNVDAAPRQLRAQLFVVVVHEARQDVVVRGDVRGCDQGHVSGSLFSA
jgi:hypothetical protein